MNGKDIDRARPERRDAAENRQRILNTALKLFEQNGVEQVSMNQIAAEAQIGPGTLYRRYRNKSELCLDLIKDNIVLLFDTIDEYLEKNRNDPPGQRLKGILYLFIRFREKRAQLISGVEESPATNSLKSSKRSPLHEDLHQLFVALFDEMNADKQGHNHPNSSFKADMLLVALSKDSYLFQRHVRDYTPEMFLEQLCLTFID